MLESSGNFSLVLQKRIKLFFHSAFAYFLFWGGMRRKETRRRRDLEFVFFGPLDYHSLVIHPVTTRLPLMPFMIQAPFPTRFSRCFWLFYCCARI